MAALIGMMDHTVRSPLPKGHLQGLQDKLALQVGRHRPADDPAAEGIQHDSEIKEPCPGRHISDVRNPQLIGAVGCEVPVDQIRGRTGSVIRPGRNGALAPTDADKTCGSHQPGDPLATDRLARGFEFGMDAWGPIGALRHRVDRSDPAQQGGVAFAASRGSALSPSVIAG